MKRRRTWWPRERTPREESACGRAVLVGRRSEGGGASRGGAQMVGEPMVGGVWLGGDVGGRAVSRRLSLMLGSQRADTRRWEYWWWGSKRWRAVFWRKHGCGDVGAVLEDKAWCCDAAELESCLSLNWRDFAAWAEPAG